MPMSETNKGKTPWFEVLIHLAWHPETKLRILEEATNGAVYRPMTSKSLPACRVYRNRPASGYSTQ